MEEKKIELIRFDWAMKKLLRNKANFDILEGFLSELLSEDIKIIKILESEGNKEDENDKHNRVDILVEDTAGEFIIIEVQNSKEYDYFHRILYGTSKVLTEYIDKGKSYSEVKKVISVTIAYFDLGQGQDYVYHGTTSFKGIHKKDILNLAEKQKELYEVAKVYEIYPEYWIIKVEQFDDETKNALDEWIYFFKNGAIKENFSAKGLKAAKAKLGEMTLSEEEKKSYKYYLRRLMDIASEEQNKVIAFEEEKEKIMKEAEKKVTEAKKEIELAEIITKEAEKKTELAEKKAKEAKKEIELSKIKAKEAEKKTKEAEKKAKEAEKKTKQADKKIGEAEKKAKEAEKRTVAQAVTGMHKIGISTDKIAEALNITGKEVKQILNDDKAK